jgi:hypothetical protein
LEEIDKILFLPKTVRLFKQFASPSLIITGLLQTPFLPPAAGRKDEARTPRAPAKGFALCTPISTRRLPDLATALLIIRYCLQFTSKDTILFHNRKEN